VVSLGSTYITFFVPFFTLFRPASSVFEVAGRTKLAMAASLIRLRGLRIRLANLLYSLFGLGAVGIWTGLALGNVGAAVLTIALLLKSDRQHRISE
jgi:Na+-driven multidrug efflux pump